MAKGSSVWGADYAGLGGQACVSAIHSVSTLPWAVPPMQAFHLLLTETLCGRSD